MRIRTRTCFPGKAYKTNPGVPASSDGAIVRRGNYLCSFVVRHMSSTLLPVCACCHVHSAPPIPSRARLPNGQTGMKKRAYTARPTQLCILVLRNMLYSQINSQEDATITTSTRAGRTQAHSVQPTFHESEGPSWSPYR